MSDTRRDRSDFSKHAASTAVIPGGVRRLMVVLACGALYFGVASLREPRISAARVAPPATAADQPVRGKLLGGFKNGGMIVELYASEGTALFRPLDLAARPLCGQLSAGELTARFPGIDIKSLMASTEPGAAVMLAEEPAHIAGGR